MYNNSLQLFDNIIKNELNLNIDISSPTSIYSFLKYEYKSSDKQVSKESKEEYKDIPEYLGHYQVSNKGNVKSLKQNKETILKVSTEGDKYYRVALYKDGKGKKFYVHRLVIQAFKGDIPKGRNLVVDHIDYNKTNNKLDNLQVISNRENLSKDKYRHNPSSSYIGVSFNKAKKKWESSISVNGASFYLGRFNNEANAGQEYLSALEYANKYSSLTGYSFKTKRKNEGVCTILNQLTFSFI